MKPNSSLRFSLPFPLAAAIAALLIATQAHAQSSGTWTQTAAGPFDWSTGATGNWSGGIVATGQNSTASFTANITAAQTVNLAEARTIGNITFTDSTTDSHNLTISGANILTMDRSSGIPVIDVTQFARTLTIGSEIAGNDGLQKSGPGTLILSANNSYSGTTTIQGDNNFSLSGNLLSNVASGSITLSGGGAIGGTSALTLGNGGSLRLVNTAQVNRFADGAAISVINGGGISYENTSGGNTYTETVGAVTLTSGQFNVNLATNQASTGSQTLTINTGGITRSGATNASAVTFSAATTGPQITGNKNMIFVTGAGSTAADEIIGSWATTGTAFNAQTDYAVYDGDYVKARGATPSTDDTGWTTSWANTSNYAWGNTTLGMTVTTTRNINTLRHTGGAEILTLNGANIGSFGILNGGSGMLTISRSGTTEVVTLPTTADGQLHVTTGNQSITINPPIANNTGALTLVKSGSGGTLTNTNYDTSGTLVLNGISTYTGDTIINAGTLRVGTNNTANGAKLGGASGDYAGNIAINAGAMLYISTNADQILSGDISGAGSLVKAYSGKLTLSGDNTYSGKTSISPASTSGAGTLEVYSFNSVNGGTPLLTSSSLGAPTTVANGTIDLGGPKTIQGGAVLRYIGTDVGGETTDRVVNISFGSNTTRTLDASGSGLLRFTSPFTSAYVDTNGIVLQGTGNGQIDHGLPFAFNNLTKTGGGTWTLGGPVGNSGVITVSGGTLKLNGAQSHAGNTTISGGTLQIGNANALGFGGRQTTSVATTTVSTGFTLDLNGTATVNEPLVLNGNGIGSNGALVNTNTISTAIIGTGIAGLSLPATGTGTGYSSAPTITISGTGTGATATISSLGLTAASFALTLGDKFYTVAPTVTIGGGSGTGATAVAVLSGGATGTLTGIAITNAGTGYSTAPTITFGAGTFSSGTINGSGTGNATNFTVSGFTMTAAGSGYTGTPTYTFSAGNASGAAVNATLSSVVLATNSSIGGAGNLTINAVVSESGGSRTLTKVGNGILTLSGANTYNGATTVSNGTLLVNNTSGSGTGAGNVSVTAGTLGGTGSISGSVTIGNGTGSEDSILAPGTSIESINTGNLTFNSDGRYAVELNGTSVTCDSTNVTGTVNINATATLTVSLTGALAGGQEYFIVVNDDPDMDTITTTFAGLAQDAVVGNYGGTDLKISYTGNSGTSAISGGNDIVLYTDAASGTAYDTWAGLKGLTVSNKAKNLDPDNDGRDNLAEFAFDGDPLSGANDGKIVGKVATVGGNQVMTLTLPVRGTAVSTTFSDSTGDERSVLVDGIYYRIEGDVNLSTFADNITEVTTGEEAAIQLGLPGLSDINGDTFADWTYRTFRAPGTVPTAPKAFLRAKVETP